MSALLVHRNGEIRSLTLDLLLTHSGSIVLTKRSRAINVGNFDSRRSWVRLVNSRAKFSAVLASDPLAMPKSSLVALTTPSQ
jgi:hypothetical protein